MNVKWIVLMIVAISSVVICLTVGLSASGYLEQTPQSFAEIKDVKLDRTSSIFLEKLYLEANVTMNEDGRIRTITGDAHMKNGNMANIGFIGDIGTAKKGETYSLSVYSLGLSKDELDQLDHITITIVPSNSDLENITLDITVA